MGNKSESLSQICFIFPYFFLSERFLAKATTTIVTHVSTIQCLHLVARVMHRLSTPPPTPYLEVRCVCATIKVLKKKKYFGSILSSRKKKNAKKFKRFSLGDPMIAIWIKNGQDVEQSLKWPHQVSKNASLQCKINSNDNIRFNPLSVVFPTSMLI